MVMNILITNLYSWYNKGDAAIVVGMTKALRRYFPTAKITALSFTPETDQEKYERHGIKVLRRLLTHSWDDPSPVLIQAFKLLLKACKYYLSARIRVPLNPSEREITDAYRQSDIILSCGGGFLGGYNRDSILQLYNIYFGKLINKPVIIYGQSIEPFGYWVLSVLTKFVLNRVDLITVREKVTLEYLRSLNLKPPIMLTADASFLVDSIDSGRAVKLLEEEGIYGGNTLVGMTVRNWTFPGRSDYQARFENYLNVMVKVIEYVITTLNCVVVLFPQTISYPKDDDRIVSVTVKERVSEEYKDKVKVLTKDYDIEELKGMCGQMALFIGTRMHSNILAASMGVPTVAISYENKTPGIMDMLGLQEYVVDISSVTTDGVIAKVNEAWQQRAKLKVLLSSRIDEVKNLAYYNAKLVKDVYEQQAGLAG